MKKVILIISLFVLSSYGFAEDKIYTQSDFDKKVDKEVAAKLLTIKNKSLTQLTQELLDKEVKLRKREQRIEQREEQLKISEQTLVKKIQELEDEKKSILGCIDENERTERMRIKQLVSVISNMKPQKAADLLSVQESEISIKIIEKIDPGRASRIFNLMDKEVSARLQKQYLNMQK